MLPAKAVPEMTYTVSGGTLNPTHSLCCHTIAARTVAYPFCPNCHNSTDKKFPKHRTSPVLSDVRHACDKCICESRLLQRRFHSKCHRH